MGSHWLCLSPFNNTCIHRLGIDEGEGCEWNQSACQSHAPLSFSSSTGRPTKISLTFFRHIPHVLRLLHNHLWKAGVWALRVGVRERKPAMIFTSSRGLRLPTLTPLPTHPTTHTHTQAQASQNQTQASEEALQPPSSSSPAVQQQQQQ